MNVSLFIAKRYFKTQGNQPFSKFLTFVACAGVAIGCASLIIVLSVMNGFTRDLEKKLLGFNSHITVHTNSSDASEIDEFTKTIGTEKNIAFVSKTIEGEAIAQSSFAGESTSMGVKVRGVDTDFFKVTDAMFSFGGDHKIDDLSGKRANAIIGNELATQLGMYQDVAEKLRLIYPFGDISPVGTFLPSSVNLQLIGIFKSGFFEYDNKYVLTSIGQALNLFGYNARYDIQIWSKSPHAVDKLSKKISAYLKDGWKISTWQDTNKRLFSALRLERTGMFTILTLIIIIATFSIVGIILMRIFRKKKDIAILASFGLPLKNISKIFIIEGAMIGAIGSGIGSIIGFAVVALLDKYPITLPDSYYLEYLPVSINPLFILTIILVGIAASVIASLYPASRATKLELVQLLRYE